MNRYIKNITLALGLALTVSVVAQETAPAPGTSNEQQQVEVGQPSSWNVSIGLGYRKFKDPKFKGGTAAGGDYIGYYTSNPSSMQNSAAAALDGTGRFTTLHQVVYSGGGASGSNKGSYGFGESIGLSIGFSIPFWQQDHISLSLVGNFSYYQLDSQSRRAAGGSGSEVTYVYNVINQTPSPYYYDAYPSSNFSSASWNKWRMDLYVFDLGVSAAYEFDNKLALFAALGPSMTIADMESNSTVATPGSTSRSTKNEFETEFGYYLSGGASFWFNERYGVSLEVRYDKAFGTIGTRYVTQDLDTWGGQLKFLCRF